MLSACETNVGEVAGGEGVFSIQRAFHIAGCRNVVASQWEVPDAPTAALMQLFYRNLWIEDQPPIEALRNAQLAVYRNRDKVKDWAADRSLLSKKTFKIPNGGNRPAAEPHKNGTTAPPRWWAAFTLSGAGR